MSFFLYNQYIFLWMHCFRGPLLKPSYIRNCLTKLCCCFKSQQKCYIMVYFVVVFSSYFSIKIYIVGTVFTLSIQMPWLFTVFDLKFEQVHFTTRAYVLKKKLLDEWQSVDRADSVTSDLGLHTLPWPVFLNTLGKYCEVI